MSENVPASTAAKNKLLLLILGLIVVVGLLVAAWAVNQKANESTSLQSSSSSTTQSVQTAVQVGQNGELVSYQGVEGRTALDLLKSHAQVETETSSLGELVVSINGVKSTDSKFWLYYVNGKQAEVGAGSYQTKSGETIEWRLEAAQ